MFKVECLGCQAPYQVDERRVPEKGLKMRCPKCGTSFKVEAPPGTIPAENDAAAAVVEDLPSPARFAPAAVGSARAPLGRGTGSGREALHRTMIGVSAGDAARAVADPAKPKGFRMPRPGAAEPAPGVASPFSGLSPTDTVVVAATEPPPTSQGAGDLELTFEGHGEEAELPAVPVPRAAAPRPAVRMPLPDPVGAAPARPHLDEQPEPEAVPESLVSPSSPLSLSELPAPLAAKATGAAKPAAPESAVSGIQLDYGGDLPVASAPKPRKPPPRRARGPAEKEQPASADLPARLEDLDRVARPPLAPEPRAVAPARAPLAPEPRPAPRGGAVAKSSSLDEVGLPAIAARPAPAAFGAPSAATSTAADLPIRAREPVAAADEMPELDLPAVGRGFPPRRAAPLTQDRAGDLPELSRAAGVAAGASPNAAWAGDLPDLPRGELPDVLHAHLPEVSGTGLPDVLAAGLPEVSGAGLPEVSAGLPDVLSAGLPEVSAGLPAVSAVGLPSVSTVGLPAVSAPGLPGLTETGLPEVSAWGSRGFGRMDLPVAREAGLPDVRPLEMDLPGVGENLPAVSEGFAEGLLPVVGDALPTAKGRGPAPRRAAVDEPDLSDAFGPEGDDGDPFADSEADLREASGNIFGDEATDSASYGEVNIAEDSAAAPLETEDMEFGAIPQRGSSPPAPRAAASATVHVDSGDAEAAGSTLELGPKRTPRNRTRQVAVVLGLCATVIAGGALALEPALGPFGIHFILDQVHRAEHERVLAELVETQRQSDALDTFKAAERVLEQFETARRNLPRFEPLQARSAYAHLAVARRFGPLPALEATAKAALDGLDPDASGPDVRLARAARAALERPTEGKGELEALGADGDVRALLGELALQAADWEAARKHWQALRQAEPTSARAAFGLARAELGAGKADAAAQLASEVLKLSPEHVGALVLRLDAQRHILAGDPKAKPAHASDVLLREVTAALPKASPGEATLAHCVLGELHSSQGRSAPAQRSFEEALAISRDYPRALLGLAETLYRSNRYGEALARFESAAKGDPASLEAQLGIAKSQIQMGRLPEAKAALTKLEAKYKNNPERIYWLGRAEQAMGAPDAALVAYRQSIEAAKGRPNSLEAYLALAKLQSELGQLVVAEQTLSEARQKLPPSGALHKAFGEIAMNRGEYASAHDHFQKALDLDSGDTRARFLAAVALARLGRFDEALAAFQSVSETDKDFPGLAVERGRLFEESGRIAEALKEYEAALLVTPDDPELQTRVGCGRVVAGKSTDAVELLEKVLKVRQRSAEVSYCLGRAFLENERYMDAIPRLERAVALDPTRGIYHLYVGWVANEVGRHGEAEAALARAIELDKGLADAYWQRGRLELKQGAVKDAVRDLERALSLKPNRHEARADLAVAHADLGNTAKAVQAWEEALARDPDHGTWHFRYGKLLSTTGKSAEAAAHLKRAIDLVSAADGAPIDRNKVPPWLWQAHYLLARELGNVAASVAHWQAYMRLSPKADPYRREAEAALAALGHPWDPR